SESDVEFPPLCLCVSVFLPPIVHPDALAISALVDAPADIAASSNHDNIDILEVRYFRVRRQLQPSRVGFAAGAWGSELVVDAFLIQPVVNLGCRYILLDPGDELLLRIKSESEERWRYGGIDKPQFGAAVRRAEATPETFQHPTPTPTPQGQTFVLAFAALPSMKPHLPWLLTLPPLNTVP